MKHIVTFLLAMHMWAPIAAWAGDDSKAKNPLDYGLGQYGLILGIALLGGIVAWWSKVRKGEIPAWSLNHLVGELSTSALAGLLCFWICEWAGFPPLLTAAMTGIFGHMGTKGLAILEEWGKSRLPNPSVILTSKD